ncbi:MAG: hypothetical protein ACETVT_00085 [bacterium]
MGKKLIFGIQLLLSGIVIFSSGNRAHVYAEEIESPYPETEGREIYPRQEESTGGESTQTSFDMYGSFGTVILTDLETKDQKIYNKLSLQPELTIGKFGFGLNLEFYFDENSHLRKEDWTWSKTIEKIWYARYGHKYDPVFVYLGGFRDVTLGHGLIIAHYTNMLRYPDIKKIGLELDLDRGTHGFESFFSNIVRAEIYGGRVYYRPFYNSYVPLLPRLGVGFTCVNDQDPDAKRSTEDDQVTVFGGDLDFPLLEHPVISILSYIDFAQMSLGKKYTEYNTPPSLDGGNGWALGFMGGILVGISYRLEFRRLEHNFIPSYFDSYYEVDRKEVDGKKDKASGIPSTRKPIKMGPYVELVYNILNRITLSASFENYNHDPTGIYPHLRAIMMVHPSLLMNKFSLLFSYDKRNAETWEDLIKVKGPNTILTVEAGYHVDPHLALVIIYRQTFDANGRPTKRTTMEGRFHF